MDRYYSNIWHFNSSLFLILLLFFCSGPNTRALAQSNSVGIGTLTPAPSALLDVNAADKGILVPRMTTTQRVAIASPANSLLVFDTDVSCFFYWDAVDTQWKALCAVPGVTGSSGATGATGATGSTGDTGQVGATGISGPQGMVGATGMSGLTGSTGATGIVGSTGSSGTTGTIGTTGFTGSTGAVGTTGATGADLGTHWTINGNAGTTAGTNFIGTTDAVDLAVFTNSTEKMRITSAGNIGIGTTNPNTSAIVDMVATNLGFAMPRTTTAQRLAIAIPAEGLQVYDTDLKGFYFFNGSNWNCVTTPAGTVDFFANATAPVGYLECNGQAVSRTQYPELFAAIGVLYGPGDGTTTFNVPDLRGEFIRGTDNGRGIDPGRLAGSGQAGTVVVGDFDPSPTPGSVSASSGSYQSLFGADPFDAVAYTPASTLAAFVPASGTGSEAALPGYFGITRPRNVALLPCIKY